MTKEDRVSFGSRLREQREARAMSLADLSKVTKIPEKSLALLEAGSLDALPAEVFVRGFVRSYCRAVGLDVDATLRSYGELIKVKSKREAMEPPPSLAMTSGASAAKSKR